MTKDSAEASKSENTTNINVRSGFGVGRVLAVVAWLGGIVLAKGWLAIPATFFPPYGWYLVMERVMQVLGLAP